MTDEELWPARSGDLNVHGAAKIVSRASDGERVMDREAASTLASADHWFRYCMPYRFVRLGSGDEHVYLPVNRGLKPLGVTSHGCFRFDAYRAQAVVFRLDPHTFEGVWFDPVGAALGLPRPRLLLYDDTPESRMD